MEDFVNNMVAKVGIDKATAEKVVEFIKEHAGDAMNLLKEHGVLEKLPGGVGEKLGGLF
jgi:hypothetical protein